MQSQSRHTCIVQAQHIGHGPKISDPEAHEKMSESADFVAGESPYPSQLDERTRDMLTEASNQAAGSTAVRCGSSVRTP